VSDYESWPELVACSEELLGCSIGRPASPAGPRAICWSRGRADLTVPGTPSWRGRAAAQLTPEVRRLARSSRGLC